MQRVSQWLFIVAAVHSLRDIRQRTVYLYRAIASGDLFVNRHQFVSHLHPALHSII
jgi:hypothetical protein